MKIRIGGAFFDVAFSRVEHHEVLEGHLPFFLAKKPLMFCTARGKAEFDSGMFGLGVLDTARSVDPERRAKAKQVPSDDLHPSKFNDLTTCRHLNSAHWP